LDGRLVSALVVERATRDDEPFVLSLAERFAETRPAWRTFSEVTDGTRAQLSAAFTRASDDEAMFVARASARSDAERLGFVYVVTHDDFFTGEKHAHVSEIAVARDGSGAGRALMAAAETWSRARGIRFVTLNVNESNVRAMRFYETLGFNEQVRQFVKVLTD
jgi:ribosomal protein S18 acetylase RimI-like enzyme